MSAFDLKHAPKFHGKNAASVVATIIALAVVLQISVLSSPPGPDLNVKVVSLKPDGSVDVGSNITVKFTKDMVPEDSLDKPLLNPPLVIEPPVQGIARWVERDILRFYPDSKLAPATDYKVRVESDSVFAHGNRINDDRTFEFHTAYLRVTDKWSYLAPEHGSPFANRVFVHLNFNSAVDLEQIIDKIEIVGVEDADKSSLDFEIRTELGVVGNKAAPLTGFSRSCEIFTEPIKTTTERQEYELRLKTGLECEDCGKSLQDEFRYAFTVEPRQRLEVRELNARQSGTTFGLELYLSTSVDVVDLEKYVSVEPQVDFTLRDGRYNLTLRGDFKPGQTYAVTVAEGAPAINGSILEREFSSRVTVPDLSPTVKFTASGQFLPRDGRGNIEIKTVNIDTLMLEVQQVFENNLVYALTNNVSSRYGYSTGDDSFGRRIHFKNYGLTYNKNDELLSTVNVRELIGDTTRGLFVVTARRKSQRWTSDSRQMMLSDIGISARMADDYLMVWAHSLEDTRPIKKATVSLISKNNQVLVEGKTDSRGIVIFDDLSDHTEGFEPYLITVRYKDDLSYLRFVDCLLPTNDFDVAGRPYLTDGYEAFVYFDRDIFRPGETAHIVSIVRAASGKMPGAFPYLLEIRDPQGRKFKTLRLTTDGSAMTATDTAIPSFAPTGRYTVTARIGEEYEIGRASFLVEEFMPDRIKVELETAKPAYVAGEVINITADAKFLFGPPAAAHRVTGTVTIEQDLFRPAGYSAYRFSTRNRQFAKSESRLQDAVLGQDGRHTYVHQLPARMTAPSSLKALLAVSVSEEGGRTVSAYRELAIHPYERYLGLKTNLEGYAKPGEQIAADIVGLDPKGVPVAIADAKAEFYRVIYNSVLKKDRRGYYRYVSERTRQLVDTATVNIPVEGASVSFIPDDYGQYEIDVTDASSGHQSTVSFYASGWGYAPWSMEEPDKIELGLDRESYEPGETARVQVRAPFAGTLLLTVERDQVLDIVTVDMEENTAEIDLPVSKDFFPNAYVSATLVRPASQVTGHTPARAFGMAPLILTVTEKSLKLTIDAPTIIKPETDVTVNIQTGWPGHPGQPGVAMLTVAAVDAGILQLTDFQTPDPLDFFYGKRRPLLKPYDMYSLVYPEVERAGSHLSPGGGAMFAEARKRHLNPITAVRVKPVALWSGLVETDKTGAVSIPFHVPQFNGKLVLMAVAVQGDRFGSASGEMTVRDRIVIQESFPRFTAPNDEIDGLVTLFNNTGDSAAIDVTLSLNGPAELMTNATQTILIANGAEGVARFKIKAGLVVGKTDCVITAVAGADTSRVTFELPNRPAQPLKTEFGSGVVTADSAVAFDLPGDWVEGTDKYILRTSSLAAVSFARNIQSLLRYPYGCVEQTTSRLFPLLYFNDLAKFVQADLAGGGGPDYFIQEGILRLSSMALADGSFSYWPGGERRHHWSSVYASHFLVEARKAGYLVDDDLYKKTLENVKKIAAGKSSDNYDEPQRIYAAFVLAKAGKLDNKMVNRLRRLDPDAIPVYSRFQMAGAIAMTGDGAYARSLIPETIQPDNFAPETGGNFNSGVRANAILLDVLLEIDPTNPAAPVLAKSLMDDARVGRWYTTQENAFALMALGKFFKGRETPDFVGTVMIGGETFEIDTASFKLDRNDLGGKRVTIAIDGAGPCFYYWQASGVGVSHAVDEFDRGIEVRREYLTEDGEPLDLNNVTLGSRVICRVMARSQQKTLHNAVISDLIPAGLEIENPRLKTSPALSWLNTTGQQPEYQDIRDDRLLLFADLPTGHELEFYYSLRAISAGEFVIPPIAAECMYNPLIAGAASSGRMIIVPVAE